MSDTHNEKSYIAEDFTKVEKYTKDPEKIGCVKEPKVSKKKGWSRYHINVEPIRAGCAFSVAFTKGLIIDYLEKYICQRNSHSSFATCQEKVYTGGVSTTNLDETTATVLMWKTIVEGIFPLAICIFIGPWSDKNGRKPFIIFPTLGFTFYFLIWGMMTLTTALPVYSYLLPSIVLSFSGGYVALLASSTNHICDNEGDNRAMRFSVMAAVDLLSNLAGTALSATVFYQLGTYGYQTMFFLSSFICGLTSIYAVFILEETIEKNQEKRTNLFEMSLIKSVLKVLVITPKRGRIVTFLVLMVVSGEIMSQAGDDNISYLVGKNQFSWSLGEYNLFSAIVTLATACINTAGMWLLKKILKLPNQPVVIVLFIGMITLQIAKGFSTSNVMFFTMAAAYSVFSNIGPLIDDELYNLVPNEDIGKAGVMFSLIDSLSPILTVAMYSQLYKFLLPNHVTYVYFLSAGILFPGFLSSLGLYILGKMSPKSFIVLT